MPAFGLCLTGSLCVAADNFDLVSLNGVLIVKLEVDVLDQKSPDFVAEPISIQVTLSA